MDSFKYLAGYPKTPFNIFYFSIFMPNSKIFAIILPTKNNFKNFLVRLSKKPCYLISSSNMTERWQCLIFKALVLQFQKPILVLFGILYCLVAIWCEFSYPLSSSTLRIRSDLHAKFHTVLFSTKIVIFILFIAYIMYFNRFDLRLSIEMKYFVVHFYALRHKKMLIIGPNLNISPIFVFKLFHVVCDSYDRI